MNNINDVLISVILINALMINNRSLKDYVKKFVFILAKMEPKNFKPWIQNLSNTNNTNINYNNNHNNNRFEMCIGTFIGIKDTHFILTCFHGIRNASNITIYQFNRNKLSKYEVIPVITSCELDLALLRINTQVKKSKKIKKHNININSFYLEFPKLNEELFTFLFKKFDYLSDNQIAINYSLCHCINRTITYERINSFNLPLMPYININMKSLPFNINESGISSSIVLNSNNQIIGMVSNMTTDNYLISVIPSITILRFLNEYIKYDNFLGICNIIAQKTLCEIEFNNQKNIAYLITECYNINYNKNLRYDNSLGHNLRTNDIIHSINNLKFNTNGYVYYDKLKCEIPFDTYIALNYMCGDFMTLGIYRMSNNHLESKNIKLKARPLWTSKYISITEENKYLEFGGFVFIELSEEMLDRYRHHGIILSGHILDYYIRHPYRNGEEKIIILIDIIRSNFTDDILSQFNEIGIPLLNIKENKYSVSILTKINKRKVINIDQIHELLENYHHRNKLVFYLKLDNNSQLKLNFINKKYDSLEIIKK